MTDRNTATAIVQVAPLTFAPTAFESTQAAPSTRAPKAYNTASKIAEIKAVLAGRLDAFEAI